MKTTTKQLSKTETQLTITADKKDLEPIRARVYDEIRKDVSAQGFRQGKAPDNIVEKQVGAQQVQQQVLEAAVNTLYSKAAVDEKLRVISQPEIEMKKFVPYTELEIEAKVEVIPEFKLPDYKKMSIKEKEAKVTKKQIDEVIDRLRQRSAKKENVDRASKEGDEVVFDFEGSQDGEKIQGGTAEKYPLVLGSGSFIPGFEENLTGLKPGEEKTFEITFPKDYGETSLAGKKAEFKVKVHEVKELKLPELDDEFAKSSGPFKNMEEMRKDVKKQLENEEKTKQKRDLQNQAVKKVADKVKVDLPKKLVEAQAEQLLNDFKQQLAYQGMDFDQYLEKNGKKEEEIKKEFHKEAKERVKTGLVITKISDEEKIEVSDKDVDNRISMLKLQYQNPQMQGRLDSPEARRDVRNQLMSEKTVDKLVEYMTK